MGQSINLRRNEMTEYERKLKEVAEILAPDVWGECSEMAKETCRLLAWEILFLEGIEIRTDDQSLPDNEYWHKEDREFEAYCAGRNDMLGAGFVKVIPKKGSVPLWLRK
jgi:hypothetical protein